MVHKLFLLWALIILGLNVSFAQSSAGVNTSSPSPKAALDIRTSTGFSQGLFIPRLKTVDRPAFNTTTPLTDAESGLMFYDIDKDSIFYWTGTNWVSLMVNSVSSPNNFWNLSGNTPDSSSNYFGTSTKQPLIFKTNNTERVRIARSGNIGIGITAPTASLDIRGISSLGSDIALRISNTAGNSLLYVSNAGDIVVPTFGAGVVTSSTTGLLSVVPGIPVTGTGAINKVAFWNTASTLSSNVNFHWDNVNSFLGIGTVTPHSPLQFSNAIANRKIVLYESFNNDQQYYGFGVNGGALRYQTDAVGADHVFYAASSATASNELMRIKGSGNVGIGITLPSAKLHVSSVSQLSLILESASTVGTWLPIGNSSVGGRYFQIISSGSGNGEGAGKLLFGTGTVAGTTSIAMTIDNTLNVGIGTSTPLANLSVAGTGTQMVHIGDVYAGNYAGITLNGTISDGSYNFLSSSADPALLINRPTGSSIQFRENNTTGLTLNPAGDNITRTAHMSLQSANTWGTSLNLYNSTSGGSTYSIVSTGSSHPLGAGSFVIQDGFNSNYAFVLNSANGDTHLSATTSAGTAVGIGYGNPATNLAGTQKLQVNGSILCTTLTQTSDQRYKTNIVSISSVMPKLRNMRGVYYDWRIKEFPDHNFDDIRQIGVIAQEVEKYYPELVQTDKAGFKSVDYPKVTPILLQAIKEMDSLMTIQNQKIDELKAENESIKKDVNSILDRLQMKPTGKTSQLLPEIK